MSRAFKYPQKGEAQAQGLPRAAAAGCHHAVGHGNLRRDKKDVRRALGFVLCSCCKHCVAVSKVRKTPHFCSFGTAFLVESKHLSATIFKAFRRSRTPFEDKFILLKLSDTPEEEGTPPSASLADPFWWLSRLHHTFGGSWVPPGGFIRCGASGCPRVPCCPCPHPHTLRPVVAPPPHLPSRPTLAFSKESFKKRENIYFHSICIYIHKHSCTFMFIRQIQPYDPTDGKMLSMGITKMNFPWNLA